MLNHIDEQNRINIFKGVVGTRTKILILSIIIEWRFDGKGLIDLTQERKSREAKISGDYSFFIEYIFYR